MSDEKPLNKIHIEKLMEYKKELQNLKNKFSKFKPTTDWNKIRIEPLLEYIGLLEKIARENLDILPEEQFKEDIVYFKKNIDGLNKVLNSEIKYSKAKSNIQINKI